MSEMDYDCPLAVIVPVYRNADTLRALAERVRATLAGSLPGYRLLFVVDASPDASWAVVEAIGAEDPNVKALRLERNVGQHRALMAGLESLRAEMYAILDADLQDPPELLLPLFEQARRGQETVFAARQGHYQAAGRMLTSRLFKRLLGWWIGLPANVGTYLVFPERVASAMRALDCRHPQVVVLARLCSARWSVQPYERALRPSGRSAYSGLGRLKAAWRGLRGAWECAAPARAARGR